jgi:hypothetical protein
MGQSLRKICMSQDDPNSRNPLRNLIELMSLMALAQFLYRPRTKAQEELEEKVVNIFWIFWCILFVLAAMMAIGGLLGWVFGW